jgi:hypothetical protein
VGLVRLIVAGDGSEDQINEWVETLERNVPDPNVSDLIFYPDEPMTPEEIVDKALAYKPIRL